MRSRILFWFLVTVVAFAWMLTVAVANTQTDTKHDKEIKLKKANGTEVSVPTNGPLSDETAQSVAAGVQSFDTEVEHWKRKQARTKSVDPAVLEEMQRIALEARNDSLDQIDLAYSVAKQSAGGLDQGLLGSAQQNIKLALEVIRTTPPESLFVRTDISSAQGTLHYCSKMERGQEPIPWHSYTPGEKLHIGLYVFRVGSTSGEAYEEQVLVLADPTSRRIVSVR